MKGTYNLGCYIAEILKAHIAEKITNLLLNLGLYRLLRPIFHRA